MHTHYINRINKTITMRTKKYLGILSLALGLLFTGCSDDEDYAIYNEPLLNEQSVVTGSSDVTATSATLHGTIATLGTMDPASYTLGFFYGSSPENLAESVPAALDGTAFSGTVTGLQNNTTIYYQAYIRLQGRLYYKGEVKSLVTTDAKVQTKDAASVDWTSAVLGGTLTDQPESSEACGVVIAAESDVETVRAGLKLRSADVTSDFNITRAGLLPGKQYYYAAFLDLGTGIVYGDVKTFSTATHDFDLDNDLVDLGLSVKWAKYNIGAKSETEVGGLYGFGDLTGCNNSIDPADYAQANTYLTANDIAYVATNGKTMLPKAADYEELFSLCQKEWVEIDGVAGYKLTGPNGNSIFLPAAGSRTIDNITGEGSKGMYMTGTINPSNGSFAISYQFDSSISGKTTTPVYQAVAVRPVSAARNVPFDKSLLYQKWYLDNGQDGEQHVFEGPFTQYGITDNWATVSNGQPNIYQQIYWEMGTSNGWIGYTYGKDYGYMEFKEDGTFFVHRIAEDGTITDETGTYTVDEQNKTVTVDIPVIYANTWIGTKSGTLKILSLTNEGMRIALPADDTYAYALNYYSEAKRKADEKIAVNLVCVDNTWAGTFGAELGKYSPEEINGTHTATYTGSAPNGMIVTVDAIKLREKYPNAIMVVNEIKCDGTPIQFDANKFFYGDIENNGNFRVELFNIYGKGSAEGKVKESPFSTAANIDNEPALAFSSSMEVTFTIITEPTYTPNLITINPSWGGPWDYNQGANFSIIVDENNKLDFSQKEFDITYESADHSAGSIMTFIEVADLYGAFPATHATLDALYLDGTEVTGWDKSMVVDSNENPKYRLELFNCYGATRDACAFGTRDGDNMAALGFSSSIRTKFTFHSLFATPQW